MTQGAKAFEERKKELFYQLLDRMEVDFILKLLDEGSGKGTEQFKRMKLKNLLNMKNAQLGKKFTPWQFLKNKVALTDLSDEDKKDIVRILKTVGLEAPNFVRYMTLMKHDEEFFNENFDKFVENVEDGRDFLHGLSKKQDIDKVVDMFIREFEKDDDEIRDKIITFTKSLLPYGAELLELRERLEGVKLGELEAVEAELVAEGYWEPLVLFVYLATGDFPDGLRRPLYYLTLEKFAYDLGRKHLGQKITSKDENESEQGGGKAQGAKNQLKRINQEKKRLEEELKRLKELSEKEKAELEEKVLTLQVQVRELTINDAMQKKQLEEYERQIGGYTVNLADDLSELKIVVGCSSPLLYAPLVFPDIKFLPVEEVNSVQKKSTNLVILQKNGLSFMNYKKITQSLKEKNIEWKEIEAFEERRVIMHVSAIIKELLGFE